jgi:hypothetical protein
VRWSRNAQVALNAGGVELPDDPKLQEQLLTLVLRGQKVTHLPGDHPSRDGWPIDKKFSASPVIRRTIFANLESIRFVGG